MKLNMDFSRPVVIQSRLEPWVATPLAGVSRRRLERNGGEVTTRATSMVRYAAGSSFTEHGHPGGEEYLVLSGTFSDHAGSASAGTYVRNPPGSRHAPFSEQGCEIFVKLEQFDSDDTEFVRIDTRHTPWTTNAASSHREILLHRGRNETVKLIALNEGQAMDQTQFSGGLEMLVLHGEVIVAPALLAGVKSEQPSAAPQSSEQQSSEQRSAGQQDDSRHDLEHGPQICSRHTWVRLPVGGHYAITAQRATQVYIKYGHLRVKG